jgi:hypothetical protein
MKETLKTIWENHKKKIIALIVMLLTSLGIMSTDLRQAIHEATAPSAATEKAQELPATAK